jgi:hypothetical protein
MWKSRIQSLEGVKDTKKSEDARASFSGFGSCHKEGEKMWQISDLASLGISVFGLLVFLVIELSRKVARLQPAAGFFRGIFQSISSSARETGI